jgi:hypothetical protein
VREVDPSVIFRQIPPPFLPFPLAEHDVNVSELIFNFPVPVCVICIPPPSPPDTTLLTTLPPLTSTSTPLPIVPLIPPPFPLLFVPDPIEQLLIVVFPPVTDISDPLTDTVPLAAFTLHVVKERVPVEDTEINGCDKLAVGMRDRVDRESVPVVRENKFTLVADGEILLPVCVVPLISHLFPPTLIAVSE